MTITVVDENGFTYDYSTTEVPMGVVTDTVAQVKLHAGTASAIQSVGAAKKRRA